MTQDIEDEYDQFLELHKKEINAWYQDSHYKISKKLRMVDIEMNAWSPLFLNLQINKPMLI